MNSHKILNGSGLLFALSLIGLGFQAFADNTVPRIQLDEKPKSMGALGDSISAGFLSHFTRQTAKLPWNQARFLGVLGSYFVTKDEDVMESPSLSWTTGLDWRKRVNSHAQRLGFGPFSGKKVINAAVSGSESLDLLEKQMFDLHFKSLKNLKQEFPDYVTFQIGPNDACADSIEGMRSVEDFYYNIYLTLESILYMSEKTRVLVPYVPNIERLRGVAKDAKVFAYESLGVSSCEDLWRLAGICPTLTTIDDRQDRLVVAERILGYNQAIQSAVNNLRKKYGDRIRESKATYDVAFTADYLSVDCFHPNKIGHNILAEETFKDTWWYKK